MSRNIGLIAARAFMPVIGAVILPLCAVAVGMAGRRILIGGLNLHSITGHGEGGSRLGGVCQGDTTLQHDPLIKDLAGLRCVRLNGHNGVLLDLVRDGGACGNIGRAIDNRERIRLYGVLGALRLDRYIVCGHDEGGGGAGLVSQCYAACLNDPLDEVCSGRSLCRNGDLNALHGAGDGCACGNGCRAAGDGNGVIPQGGDLGILVALSMAAGAFLMLLAGLTRRRFLIHYPYPGMLGGFGVVCGFAGLLALGAGTAVIGIINLPPCGEVVGFELHITACRAASGMLAVVQHRPIAVVMRMGAILNDVVDRIGVGENGQIGGVVCIQLILGNGDGDGISGGRRGHTADGNGQGFVVAVRIRKLLHLGGQTCGQVEPGGNIVACRNILKAVAVHADDHILRQRLADLAADGHIVDGGGVSPGVGGGCILTGEMLYIILSIRSFRIHILKATCIEGDRSEFIYRDTRLRIVCRPRTDGVGITGPHKAVFHLHAIQGRGCQISRDAAGVGHALRGDGGVGQGRIGILGEGSLCQGAPLFGICGSVVIVGSCLDGGGLRQRDTLGIRVGISGRGAGLGVCAVGGVGDFKDFLTGVQGVGDGHLDFPDELRSVSGGKLHLGSLRPVDPADLELVAGELLTVCRHNDGIGLFHRAALFGDIHRDGVSGVDKEVAAGGHGGVALLQLPLGDGRGEGDGSLAAVIHLRPAVDGLLGERNLLESGVHFHITVRHNKGCFLLGRIYEGHAGGIRIPLGEHHVVGGVIFRLHSNGFPSHCRGGTCRAVGVSNLDAVRHGCGGFFLRRQLPKTNEVFTDLCLRATKIGPEVKAEGIYAFLKLEVRQLHAGRNLVTHGGIGLANNPRVVYSLAVLEDSQTVAEVDLTGVAVIHFLQLLVADGGDIDILCQGAVAAKRHITGNGNGAIGGKRRAIANGQLHVLQRVRGQCCDLDGFIVAG